MAKAGLLRQNRESVPVTYTLSDLGRREAGRLS
jgi:DNA-binding transcriptional regulator PaaX